jgi:integrase
VRRNAAALVDPPKGAATELDDVLDADEARAVLDTAVGDRLEDLAVLVLAGRSPRGRDLQPSLGRRRPRRRNRHHPGGQDRRRTVALPKFVVVALRAHRIRQLEERLAVPIWEDPNLVFASMTGTRLDPRNVLRWWHDLTIRAGVGRRRFHASRHTAATLMLNAGVPLEVVSATLGHARYAITADVYAKVRPQLQRRAADAMEGLLGSGGEST